MNTQSNQHIDSKYTKNNMLFLFTKQAIDAIAKVDPDIVETLETIAQAAPQQSIAKPVFLNGNQNKSGLAGFIENGFDPVLVVEDDTHGVMVEAAKEMGVDIVRADKTPVMIDRWKCAFSG